MSTTKTTNIIPDIHVSILSHKEDDHFVAHCLEMDIVTTASTLDGAVKDLLDLIVAHVVFAYEHNNTQYIYSPAPPEVWRMFAEAQKQHTTCPPQRYTEKLLTAGRPHSRLEADRFCYV